MLLPRTLKIKFGEEYSSNEYYILLYVYCYSMTMRRKTYKMISNKKRSNLVLCLMFEQFV